VRELEVKKDEPEYPRIKAMFGSAIHAKSCFPRDIS